MWLNNCVCVCVCVCRLLRKCYRATYDETLWDVKKKVEKMTGTPAEKLQIFHHKRELADEEYKERTLDEMNLHTGFSLMAYDLVCHNTHKHTHTSQV